VPLKILCYSKKVDININAYIEKKTLYQFLFGDKINSKYQELSLGIKCSLYVGDFCMLSFTTDIQKIFTDV